MTLLKELSDCLKELDEDAILLNTTSNSFALLKRFAVNLITLSKLITVLNEDAKKRKAKLEKDISVMVLSLMNNDGVKHQNKAKNIAETHYQSEKIELVSIECMLEKANILYRAYDKLFFIGHTELKYLAKDIAIQNMEQQYVADDLYSIDDEHEDQTS